LNGNAIFEYNGPTYNSSSQIQSQTGNWNVIGIDPQKEIQVTTIHNGLIAGSYLSPDDHNQIVLGVEISAAAKQTVNHS